jgi:hypothetical protein
MAGISEKEVGGVLSVALAANLALNGHLTAQMGVISAEQTPSPPDSARSSTSA